jgi:hypothetical protein
MDRKRRNAQVRELESMASKTSIWIARLFKHVKINPHLLELAIPPLVRLVWIVHGPKTSNPTLVNGGGVSVLSEGRSAMC